MRRLMIMGVLVLAGCRGVVGPFERNRQSERIDDPSLTISEQQRRGRDRLALPEQSSELLPRTGAELQGSQGR